MSDAAMKTAAQFTTAAGAAIALVTLIGMLVGGIIWNYTVKADTDRALTALGKLERRMDEQTAANRKRHDALLTLTFSVDALTRAYQRRPGVDRER